MKGKNMSKGWKRLASILWNGGAILFYILMLADVVVGLFVDIKETLNILAFCVSILVVGGFTCYCLEVGVKDRREDWELYHDFDSLLVGLELTIGILLMFFTTPPVLLHIMTYRFCLLLLPILSLSMLTYYSLVLKWRNAIFYARSFILSGVGLLGAFIILSAFKENGKEDGIAPYLGLGLILLVICTLAIKGFMITFGTNAQKVFPSEKRNTKWYEVLLVLFLAFAPILIWNIHY